MEPPDVAVSKNQQLSTDTLPFARSYQLEALETALRQNAIVYLETGSGKTLIAIMLLRSYAYLLRKPSPYIAVFLVPTVVPVTQEFYHRQLTRESAQLPRIFGMTASSIKCKGSSTADRYWQKIHDLENLMNFKVCTCGSESVLAEYIPFSNTKLKIYKHVDIPSPLFLSLAHDQERLKEKHECTIPQSNLSYMRAGSARRRLSKLYSAFLFCLSEMGAWLAFKAAEFLSSEETDFFSWGELDIRDFSLGASKIFSARLPSGPQRSIGGDIQENVDAGYLSSKVNCLLESLLEYRDLNDLRCIIYVERIITTILRRSLLVGEPSRRQDILLWCSPRVTTTAYPVYSHKVESGKGRMYAVHKIVEEFREGVMNIIVATSILEEGLDVQSCNLVIRFDPSTTVCSFIQSRGRARMQNSDFILMVRSTWCRIKAQDLRFGDSDVVPGHPQNIEGR